MIGLAIKRAGDIMDNNRTSQYQEAATWLEKAVLAYEAAGRTDDWSRLLEELIAKHRRKYKLRPLLEAMR